MEPLSPNSKHSVWSSISLPLSSPPTSIQTLPSPPASQSSTSNLSTFSAAVSDRYLVLSPNSNPNLLYLAGEGTHNAVRIFPPSTDSTLQPLTKGLTLSTSSDSKFYGYSKDLGGVAELTHPSSSDRVGNYTFFNSSTSQSVEPATMEVIGEIAITATKGVFRAFTKGRKGFITSPTNNQGVIFDFGEAGLKGKGCVVDVTPWARDRRQSVGFNNRREVSVLLTSYKSCVVVNVGWNEGAGRVWTGGQESKRVRKLPAEILSATSYTSSSTKRPLIALLLSSKSVLILDSLCLSVPLTTVTLDPAPFFDISVVQTPSNSPLLIATASDGESRCIIPTSLDSRTSEIERSMKLAIDAMGRTGWPLANFAEALGVSYASASYEGEGAGSALPDLLTYTGTILGIGVASDEENVDEEEGNGGQGKKRQRHGIGVHALLCLACASLAAMDAGDYQTPKVALASARGAPHLIPSSSAHQASQKVCGEVSKLLLSTCNMKGTGNANKGRLAEAGFLLFARAGLYEDALDAMDVLKTCGWSKFKYDNFACQYLRELWETGDRDTCKHAMDKSRGIFESNPNLGLWIFVGDKGRGLDHVIGPLEVCSFFKTLKLNPGGEEVGAGKGNTIPFNSGNALAAEFLIKAVGLDEEGTVEEGTSTSEALSAVHDQLCLILLEGIIGEVEEDFEEISPTAQLYKARLHKFLKWESSKYNPETLMDYIPDSFKIEKALLLGKMDNQREAIELLYSENNLAEALEFCDTQHAILKKSSTAAIDPDDSMAISKPPCAYLPLIEAALDNDCVEDAIEVMISRKDVVDQGAALRALPPETPMQSLRNFLVPALKSKASKFRQLSVAANLIRARQQELQKLKLNTNLLAQSTLENVVELKGWKLGAKRGESTPIKVHHNLQHSNQFPFTVDLTKHFFKRHVVLQARITNTGNQNVYDCGWAVAEVSDDALQPTVQLNIPLLPPNAASCSFNVLERRAQAVEAVVLTTEMRWARGEETGIVEDMQDIQLNVKELGG